jgi:hypothetical protein
MAASIVLYKSHSQKNLTIDLFNHPTGQHGFDIEDNNDRSRQIIMRTIEFIKAHH